jgi:hypothetical protein
MHGADTRNSSRAPAANGAREPAMKLDLPVPPPPPSDPLQEPPARPALPADGVGDAEVERDLPCIRCQYNLRALRGDGRCPECGLPVMATLRRNVVLSETDVRWLETLRRGAYFLAASMVVWGVATFILVQTHSGGFVAAPLILSGPRTWPLPFAWGERQTDAIQTVLLPGLAALVLYTIGIWHVAAQEPALRRVERDITWRRVLLALAAALPVLVCALAWCLQARPDLRWFGWNVFTRDFWPPWVGAFALLDTAVHVLLFARLRHLASRVLDDALVREARALGRAQAVALAVISAGGVLTASARNLYPGLVTLACVPLSLAGLGVLVLMFAFVRAFGQSAVAARAGDPTPYAVLAAAPEPDGTGR